MLECIFPTTMHLKLVTPLPFESLNKDVAYFPTLCYGMLFSPILVIYFLIGG